MQIRQNNGFRHVRVVCPKADYLLVRRLHDFTAEVLEVAGTGEAGGLSQWKMKEFAQRLVASLGSICCLPVLVPASWNTPFLVYFPLHYVPLLGASLDFEFFVFVTGGGMLFGVSGLLIIILIILHYVP